jgi:hypothetical protein
MPIENWTDHKLVTLYASEKWSGVRTSNFFVSNPNKARKLDESWDNLVVWEIINYYVLNLRISSWL